MHRQLWCESIAPGQKVWWNDPEGISNGDHVVVRVNTDPKQTTDAAIVVIENNYFAEREVPVSDLTVSDLSSIFPKKDWQLAVANGDTELSLEEWQMLKAECCEWPIPEPRIDQNEDAEETIEIRWTIKLICAEKREHLQDFAEQLQRDLFEVVADTDGYCTVVKDTGQIRRVSSMGKSKLTEWVIE